MSAPAAAKNAHKARIDRTRGKVIAAAARLLIERGPAAFTVEAVVERTGVALTTIYRHWPSRTALLAEAISALGERVPTPDTGSLRTDLLEFVTTRAHALGAHHWDRRMQTLPGLIEAGQRDPILGGVVKQVIMGVLKGFRLMLERGQARGEVRMDRDLDAMTDVLFGAIVIRRAFRDEELSDTYLAEIIDTIIEGVAPAKRS